MGDDISRSTGSETEIEELPAPLAARRVVPSDAQARLRGLAQVNEALASDLDLPAVLRTILEIGTSLLCAGSGAIEVMGVGGEPDRVIRLRGNEVTDLVDGLARPPQSLRSPPRDRPMGIDLEVPVRVGDTTLGHLSVADGPEAAFGADDEELARALAASAAVAMEKARLLGDLEHRARWSTALADVARHQSSADDGSEVDLMIERVADQARAQLVSVIGLADDGQHFTVDRVSGRGAGDVKGMRFPAPGTAGERALTSGRPVLVSDPAVDDGDRMLEQVLLHHAMVIPVAHAGLLGGVLVLARSAGQPPFTTRDLDMGAWFADHVDVALERVEAREARRQSTLLEDRARIARDLHDLVIQQLFGAGLSLQTIAGASDSETSRAITEQIVAIDGAIAQIRHSIFAMKRVRSSATPSLRSRVLEIVDQAKEGVSARARFLGPVDLVAGPQLVDDVVAVVTEGVSNAVKHAEASAIEVVVSAEDGHLCVDVTDDGLGMAASDGWSGLANLGHRAAQRGGTFDVGDGGGRGTRLTWTVPLAGQEGPEPRSGPRRRDTRPEV